jgi:hypothetical protein
MSKYRADLPPDLKGHSIDTAHPLYKAFEADAAARGMSQEAFSGALAAYARGAVAKSAPAAPAPAAVPPPAAKPNFEGMSTREAFAHSLAHGSTPSYRGHRG